MDILSKGLKVALSLSLLLGLSACCTDPKVDLRAQINAAQATADQALVEAQNCAETCDRAGTIYNEFLRK